MVHPVRVGAEAGDWVLFTKLDHLGPKGEEGHYKQLSRVFYVSADGEKIVLETPLSVRPLHTTWWSHTVLREAKKIPTLRTRMIVAMVGLVCSAQLS